MKIILITFFTLIFSCSVAQKVDTTTVTQSVKLTEWQEKQLMAFEEQKKRIEENYRLLWLAILDANGVDEKSIIKVDYKPRELIIKKRK